MSRETVHVKMRSLSSGDYPGSLASDPSIKKSRNGL